jgi:hypothetical protein
VSAGWAAPPGRAESAIVTEACEPSRCGARHLANHELLHRRSGPLTIMPVTDPSAGASATLLWSAAPRARAGPPPRRGVDTAGLVRDCSANSASSRRRTAGARPHPVPVVVEQGQLGAGRQPMTITTGTASRETATFDPRRGGLRSLEQLLPGPHPSSETRGHPDAPHRKSGVGLTLTNTMRRSAGSLRRGLADTRGRLNVELLPSDKWISVVCPPLRPTGRHARPTVRRSSSELTR